MNKHTPGPWRSEQSSDGKRIYLMDFKASPNIICEWDEFEWPAPEDLCLIEAAPDLLAALNALILSIRNCSKDKGMGAKWQLANVENWQAMKNALTTIAKVKGK